MPGRCRGCQVGEGGFQVGEWEGGSLVGEGGCQVCEGGCQVGEGFKLTPICKSICNFLKTNSNIQNR